ncbi:MAG: cytochrome [Nanoarchaeota archaeon]
MRKTIIGVMGPPGGEASKIDEQNAYQLGELIAENNWVLLTGGGKEGVMGAANKGAKAKGGLTVGILSNDDPNRCSEYVDIPIITNMQSGRNYMNVLSCDVVIACGMNPGTASEVALAIKPNKQIILLNDMEESKTFFKKLSPSQIHLVSSPKEAIELTKKFLEK